MTKLSVNLNRIALLRNTRNIDLPNVANAAGTVVAAGAYGITVHPRPDQRHIRYSDVYELSQMLTVEFNIEGNPFTGRYMDLVLEVKPNQATLVPDEPAAITSDHGWDLEKNKKRLRPVIKKLKDAGIRVSLFMDADIDGIRAGKALGADRIELYTEPYARAFQTGQNLKQTLGQYTTAAKFAQDNGLGVNAGHDLNLKNLGKFCGTVKGVLEVSIGHALIAEAIDMGLYNTVKEYLKVLSQA